MPYTLTATKRDASGPKLSELREQRLVPAVLYGFKVDNQSLQVESTAFQKIYSEAGENQIVELSVGDGSKVNVLIKEVQIHPVRRDVIHADFQAVDVSQPVIVEVPLRYTGEAPAVKASGGSLVKKLSSIEIKCLPVDLPKVIEVPLASLETLEDSIHVNDIKVSDKIEILHDLTDMVATVVPPKVEAEPTPAAEAEAEGEAAAEGGEEKKEGAPAEGGEEKKEEAAS